MDKLIAHVREKDHELQSLEEHLSEASIIAGHLAEKIGLKETGQVYSKVKKKETTVLYVSNSKLITMIYFNLSLFLGFIYCNWQNQA